MEIEFRKDSYIVSNEKFFLNCIVIFPLCGLFACSSLKQESLESEINQLNGEQAKSHIYEATEVWTEAKGYEVVPYTFMYKADGVIEVIWKGKKLTGIWEVSNEGMVCYKIPEWEKYCYFYIDDNGSVRRKYVGAAR